MISHVSPEMRAAIERAVLRCVVSVDEGKWQVTVPFEEWSRIVGMTIGLFSPGEVQPAAPEPPRERWVPANVHAIEQRWARFDVEGTRDANWKQALRDIAYLIATVRDPDHEHTARNDGAAAEPRFDSRLQR